MTENTSRGWVLISGAGRGIGQALALRLAASRFPLILVSRTAAHLQEVVRQCANSVPIRSAVMDVSQESEVRGLRSVLEPQVPLHAIVNNAGVGEWSCIGEMTAESWDRQLSTNLRGPFLLIRETIGQLRDQGRGLYVNIGSDCCLVGRSGRAAYNASKFGLVGLTAALRAEVSEAGIHSSLVYLGKVDTHFRGHRPGDRPGALSPKDAADAIAFVIESYPRIVIEEISLFPPSEGLHGTPAGMHLL